MLVRDVNLALEQLLRTDERIILLGEDIVDPYGGAFKVTRGLSALAPNRVLSTPISEAAIVGIAAGLAMEGFRPIVEVMFGDFLTLTVDQVLNHITKYPDMYNNKVSCPVMIRTPSGGHRGYGPTHSQSLEKHFLGIPNFVVLAASPYHDPLPMYRWWLEHDKAALFIEQKLLYPEPLQRIEGGRIGSALATVEGSQDRLPTICMSWVPRRACTVTVVAYGYAALLAARVLEELAVNEEVFGELLVPAQLAPLDLEPISSSVERTGSLVTIEEGAAGWSWGTEVATSISRDLFPRLRKAPDVLASAPSIIPSSRRLEEEVLVGREQMRRHIREGAT